MKQTRGSSTSRTQQDPGLEYTLAQLFVSRLPPTSRRSLPCPRRSKELAPCPCRPGPQLYLAARWTSSSSSVYNDQNRTSMHSYGTR